MKNMTDLCLYLSIFLYYQLIFQDVNSFMTNIFYGNIYIPKIKNFGDIMVLVWTPHAKACVSRNCNTNACIKFIFDKAIDDLEWNNPINFGEYRKTKIVTSGHFMKI